MLILRVYKYLKSEIVNILYVQGPNFTGQAKPKSRKEQLKMWWYIYVFVKLVELQAKNSSFYCM